MQYKPPKNRFLNIFFHREFLAANAVAIAGASLFLFSPRENSWDEYILAFGTQYALPACFIWFILRRSLKEYGFGWGKKSALFNSGILILSLGVFLGISWLFLSGTSIGKDFVTATGRSLAGARTSFPSFLLYAALSVWFIGLDEFFFRGFLLLSWKKALGKTALLAHGVFLGIFLFVRLYGLPIGAFEGALLLFGSWSLIASFIAFSTESVFLSFCFSLFSDILTTVFVIALS